VLTTVAEWAKAYAQLAEEKDSQLAVLIKNNLMLLQEKDALAAEKEELAKQLAAAISQCTVLGNSRGLLCMLVVLVCEALFALT
jgi:hypothetical protein